MWISRKRYNKLVEENETFKTLESKHRYNMDMLRDNIEIYSSENKTLRQELEKYKQKYADEVNKRLELIELYEGKV